MPRAGAGRRGRSPRRCRRAPRARENPRGAGTAPDAWRRPAARARPRAAPLRRRARRRRHGPRAAPRDSSGPGRAPPTRARPSPRRRRCPASSALPTSPSRAPESAISPSVPSRSQSRCDFGAAAMLVGAIRAGQPFGEPQVAGARLREQQRAERLVALGLVRQPDVAAEDRLDAARARRVVELDEAERVGEIGDRERRHAVGDGRGDAVVDAHGAVDDRELAVQAQVDEAGRGHERNRKGARILLRSSVSRSLLRCVDSSAFAVVCALVRRVARSSPSLALGAWPAARRWRRVRRRSAARRRAAYGAADAGQRRAAPAAVNLSGFPLPYRQGYADGCASATGPERKDAVRFAADGNYRTGWNDGLALCRKK